MLPIQFIALEFYHIPGDAECGNTEKIKIAKQKLTGEAEKYLRGG